MIISIHDDHASSSQRDPACRDLKCLFCKMYHWVEHRIEMSDNVDVTKRTFSGSQLQPAERVGKPRLEAKDSRQGTSGASSRYDREEAKILALWDSGARILGWRSAQPAGSDGVSGAHQEPVG